jgi:hypothetical protein
MPGCLGGGVLAFDAAVLRVEVRAGARDEAARLAGAFFLALPLLGVCRVAGTVEKRYQYPCSIPGRVARTRGECVVAVACRHARREMTRWIELGMTHDVGHDARRWPSS